MLHIFTADVCIRVNTNYKNCKAYRIAMDLVGSHRIPSHHLHKGCENMFQDVYLVGGFKHFLLSIIYWIILPIDIH
jgi:hypothetical protein